MKPGSASPTPTSCLLDIPSEHITVRDLIRARVSQEMHEYNARQLEVFRGLVQPTDAERTLNGFRLRHTAASLLLMKGTHRKKVQELLGHSSMVVTLDTYSHLLHAAHEGHETALPLS